MIAPEAAAGKGILPRQMGVDCAARPGRFWRLCPLRGRLFDGRNHAFVK